jgi:hypothetical protein
VSLRRRKALVMTETDEGDMAAPAKDSKPSKLGCKRKSGMVRG